MNSDSEGYHETITRVFLHGVRLFLGEADRGAPLHELVNALLQSPMGRRDWPFRFYSRERLLSVDARRELSPRPRGAFLIGGGCYQAGKHRQREGQCRQVQGSLGY